MAATGREVVPNWSAVSDWKKSRTPTEATTLASTGARRSGRNTSRCTRIPMSAHDPTPNTNAGQNEVGPPSPTRCGIPTTGRTKSPVERSSAYTYVPHMAVAPVAKLMTPVPR